MSDYISKSALIKELKKHGVKVCSPNSIIEIVTRTIGGCIGIINEQPTLDEKEIIRKCGEQIVDKLKNLYPLNPYPNPFSNGRDYANIRAINLVKEECGISE